jgi:hypothetical protein
VNKFIHSVAKGYEKGKDVQKERKKKITETNQERGTVSNRHTGGGQNLIGTLMCTQHKGNAYKFVQAGRVPGV